MSKSQVTRYDVVYGEYGPHLQRHFCREWEDDRGCYGTNPHHGMSFGEAVEHIAEYHETQAAMWRAATEGQWERGEAP